MRRSLALLTVVAVIVSWNAAHADSDGGAVPGPVDEFTILTGFSAKESCSCVFVDGQTDTYCTAYGQDPPYTTTLAIDHNAQTVTATFGSTTRTARATNGAGCVLDPLQ